MHLQHFNIRYQYGSHVAGTKHCNREYPGYISNCSGLCPCINPSPWISTTDLLSDVPLNEVLMDTLFVTHHF